MHGRPLIERPTKVNCSRPEGRNEVTTKKKQTPRKPQKHGYTNNTLQRPRHTRNTIGQPRENVQTKPHRHARHRQSRPINRAGRLTRAPTHRKQAEYKNGVHSKDRRPTRQPRRKVAKSETKKGEVKRLSSWLSWYRGVLDVADRLPVVVQFSAHPRVSLKTVDPSKGNGRGQRKTKER